MEMVLECGVGMTGDGTIGVGIIGDGTDGM